MDVELLFGQERLAVNLPDGQVTVLSPPAQPALPDEQAAFRAAVRDPMGTPPLRELIAADETVAVVIPDITRPLPSDRLLPWLFHELDHVPPEQIVIVNGTGSHRANTPAELAEMLGEEILERYRVVNHDAHDPGTLVEGGRSPEGTPICFNREVVRADRRIILGFIEPHFMAGFSGGYKAVFPGVLGIDGIMHYHRATVIGDPRSTWGTIEGNPTQQQVRQGGALLPVDFCINVTLDSDHRISRFFCGETVAAHDAGCAYAKATMMSACPQPFPIVITTNCGYPLDQNLYQAVKGMSAAAQIVSDGGLIIAAAECRDGFPDHGNFRQLLFDHKSPEALLATIQAPGFSMYDQWEAQILALICRQARVALHSSLPAADVRRAYLEPIDDIGARVGQELERIGEDAPIAVLPAGFMTIPYLADQS